MADIATLKRIIKNFAENHSSDISRQLLDFVNNHEGDDYHKFINALSEELKKLRPSNIPEQEKKPFCELWNQCIENMRTDPLNKSNKQVHEEFLSGALKTFVHAAGIAVEIGVDAFATAALGPIGGVVADVGINVAEEMAERAVEHAMHPTAPKAKEKKSTLPRP